MKLKKSYFLSAILIIIAVISLITILLRVNSTKKNEFKCPDCNIILINLDALRADHLGIYGYGKNTSPNIDNFAKNSYVFNNSISQSGNTFFSVPSYLTSQLPSTNNLTRVILDGRAGILKEAPVTIAEILKQKGYHTYGIISYSMVGSKRGFSQGFETFDEKCSENGGFYCFADSTTERAINLLNKSSEQPFFMWVYYREPHSPYNPPLRVFEKFNSTNESNQALNELNESRQYYDQKIEELLANNASKKQNRTEYTLFGEEIYLNTEDIEWLKNAYDGNIYYADEQLGMLLNYLNESGLLKKTIVIITSDHGEILGEHEFFDHGPLYYEGIHTPLIIYFPKHKGGTINYPVSNLDIAPTILEGTGLNTPFNFSGKNAFDGNREDYIQFAERYKASTIIKDGWKLMTYGSSDECNPKNEKLFYIINDSKENFNLAYENVAMCNYLKGLVLKIRQNYTFYINEIDNEIEISQNEDSETIKKLEALGYVG